MPPIEELIGDLTGKYLRITDEAPKHDDDNLLIDLRKQLDDMLEKNTETHPMEICTLLVMRAFRNVREVV